MKKQLLIAIVTFFVTINSFSQDLELIKVEANKIYTATTNLKYEDILDVTYPKVFEILPKDKMKEVLISTFSGNDKMKIKLLPADPDFEFGAIKTIDGAKYCLIKHNLAMEMTIAELGDDDPEMYVDIFKASMKAKSVTYDKTKKSFTIELRSTMIGIFDKYTEGKWKFLNKGGSTVLINKLLGEKVVKQLELE